MGFFIAFGVGFRDYQMISNLNRDNIYQRPNINDKLMEFLDQETLGEYLKGLRKLTGWAGQREQEEMKQIIKDRFSKNLDHVSESSYRVQMSYPNLGKPNKVETLEANGNVLKSEDFESSFSYNAFADSGTEEGDAIFANFGRYQDFLDLKELQVLRTVLFGYLS